MLRTVSGPRGSWLPQFQSIQAQPSIILDLDKRKRYLPVHD